MAIVKLVCQGCGANLDADSNTRVVQCQYCGTANALKQTVAAPPPQPQPPPQPAYIPPPPPQIAFPQPQRSGSGVGLIITFAALLPVLIGVGVTIFAVSSAQQLTEEITSQVLGGNSAAATQDGRNFRWESGRPYIADVDGDGTEDIVGLIQPNGGSEIVVTAFSGKDWSSMWEAKVGDRSTMPGQPELRFLPEQKLALFALGTTLHAYDAKTGSERWVANLPDKIDAVALDGDKLWVRTIDETGSFVTIADGKVDKAEATPPASAKAMRTDAGYELIPDERTLDLEYQQFEGLSVQAAYCPKEEQGILSAHSFDKKECSNPHGLAFATREKGSQVPFLLAYDRKSKAEQWRVQLTAAGSLETVDTGFGQPRIELIGPPDQQSDAIVSFVRSNESNDARIRRFALADGSSKWEVVITRKTTENVDGMVAGSTRLFVNYGGGLHVLDLGTGESQAKLGGW
ncbi:MAG: PQQ-binding-like beta-propeller repeat protein [Myxococcales bacterium]|nr:PQQ-binding-like beta-propeller repeat protein [Myxococcales bacterium]